VFNIKQQRACVVNLACLLLIMLLIDMCQKLCVVSLVEKSLTVTAPTAAQITVTTAATVFTAARNTHIFYPI